MKKTILALTVLAGFAAYVPAANAGGYWGYGNRYYSGSRWCDDCGSRVTYRSWNYSRWDDCDD